MRYRLRTLLIVLAVGPMVLAGVWIIGKSAIDSLSYVDVFALTIAAILLAAVAPSFAYMWMKNKGVEPPIWLVEIAVVALTLLFIVLLYCQPEPAIRT